MQHDDANQTYNNFVSAHKDATGQVIPKKPKSKRTVPWETQEISRKRQLLRDAASRKNSIPTRRNLRLFNEAQRALTYAYESEQKKYIEQKINELKTANENNQSSLAWKIISEISGKKRPNKSKLRANSQQERLNLWKNHFSNLLGKNPVVSDAPIQNIVNENLPFNWGNFTMNELESVLKKPQNSESCWS